MFRLSVISILCASAFSMLWSSPAEASLRDSFDFYKRTPGGTYSNEQMKGWVGPAFNARNNMVNPRIVDLQIPAWNAGCGGIDFFAGSFSIVSKDELVQMARGIAQGAPGYFFNLAMGAVCPSCQEQMAELQKKLEKFNELTQDSCQRFWDKFEDTTNLQASARGKMAVFGTDKDALAGFIPDFGDFFSSKSTKTGISDNQAAEATANNILNHMTGAVQAAPSQPMFADLSPAELFASLFGTVISAPINQGTDQQKIQLRRLDHKIDLKKVLFNPAGETITVLKCADLTGDPQCLNMVEVNLPFEGLVTKNTRLLVNSTGATSDYGILLKIVGGTEPFSTEQNEFRLNTRYSYEQVVKEFKDHLNLIPTMGEHLALLVAADQLKQFYHELRDQLLAQTAEGKGLSEADKKAIRDDIDAANQRFDAAIDELHRSMKRIEDSVSLTSSLSQLIQVNR